jgi:hypothetical protein
MQNDKKNKIEFVLLVSMSDIEAEMVMEQLRQHRIPYKVQSYNQNAFLQIYGASSILGKQIHVPIDKLEKARQILNIPEKVMPSPTDASTPAGPTAKFIVATVLIGFLVILIFQIASFFQ